MNFFFDSLKEFAPVQKVKSQKCGKNPILAEINLIPYVKVRSKHVVNQFVNTYKTESKYLSDMINSFSSLKQFKPAHNYSNKHDFDDDDDVITSASGLINSII